MTAVRDRTTGRFRPIRSDWPTCAHCGSILYQRFDGEQVCPMTWCARARRAGK